MLPTYLHPWGYFQGTWPANAGPMPDQDAVNMARQLLGAFGERSKCPDLAIIMYCRLEGASNAEVRSATGDAWTNKARTLHLGGQLDFLKAKKSDGALRYFIGPLGSQPGPPNAEPFVQRLVEHRGEPFKMNEIPEQIVEIVDRRKAVTIAMETITRPAALVRQGSLRLYATLSRSAI